MWRSKLVRTLGLTRSHRVKDRCIPPWRPFAVFLSLYFLFLLANPWWRLHPKPRASVVAKFDQVIELPPPTQFLRDDPPIQFMNAALIECDGYYGAFSRLNDQTYHMSWPMWMPLSLEDFKPLAPQWTIINITDWVPLDGRGFRASGYEDLRVVRHKGQIWTSGTASFRVHGRSFGEYRPMLVAWEEPKDMAPPVPTDRRYILTEEHAKNWGPFVVDEQLYLFQDAQPFRICIFNLDHCDIIAEVPHTLHPFGPSLFQAPTLRAARIIGRIPSNVTRDQWEYLGVAHYRVNRWKSTPWYYFIYFTIHLHGAIRIKRFSSIISFEELGPANFWYLHTAFIRPRPASTLERMKLTEFCKSRPLHTNCYEVVSTISPSDYGAVITIQSLTNVLQLFPS